MGGVLCTLSASIMGIASFVIEVRAGAEVVASSRLASVLTWFSMKRQTVITKKRRGPAPTGKGTLIGVRLQPRHLKALNAWIAKQKSPVSRPEAIRALLAEALEVEGLG
jgi:hypothetical protein